MDGSEGAILKDALEPVLQGLVPLTMTEACLYLRTQLPFLTPASATNRHPLPRPLCWVSLRSTPGPTARHTCAYLTGA